MRGKIRVLIVDDSALARKILAEALAGAPDIEVAGTAPDPYVARDLVLGLRPDVLTLDLDMPRMDGLTFLKKLMQYRPTPVIVVSALARNSCQLALEALRAGAVEVLGKPGQSYPVDDFREELPAKVRAAAAGKLGEVKPAPPSALAPAAAPLNYHRNTVIAIGASTGGTEAIRAVLEKLPASSPGILIAQHIPPVFSQAFAKRLNETCAVEVKEASDGDTVRPGRALVAPGNLHMMLERTAAGYHVAVRDGPRVCYQRPSADVLFRSVATAAGRHGLGLLLTGMGSDGARGLREMREAGAWTAAQDEASSVVYGMPRAAVEMGAAGHVLPLESLPRAILRHLRMGGTG